MVNTCPNCGYDINKHLTRSEKKKRKEKARFEKLQRENPDKCFCKEHNYDKDEVVEIDVYVKGHHMYDPRLAEDEGPCNKRKCSKCEKFYIDTPPMAIAFA